MTTAIPGSPPTTVGDTSTTVGDTSTTVGDTSTTYSVTTNLSGGTITGAIDVAMPADAELDIQPSPPTGATSTGLVSLTTTPQNLVTGIGPIAQSGLGITYGFTAESTVSPFSSTARTVTLTLTFHMDVVS